MNTNENDIGFDAGDDNERLPPLPVQPQPGFLKFFPPIVRKIAELGGDFRMEQDGSLYVNGFYKNGPMKIDFENDKLIAIDKRGRKTSINDFSDLVLLNFQWWRMSNTKTNYVVPERPWLDQFIEKKWVKRKVIFEPIDGNVEGDEDQES